MQPVAICWVLLRRGYRTALTPLHAWQLWGSLWCHQTTALIRMTITARLKLRPSETKLATLTLIMWAIQTIVFAVTFHDWSDREKFSMAVLRWKHVSSICMDHTIARTRPRMHISRELIWLVKSPIDQISCIIVRIFIEWIEERPAWLWKELYRAFPVFFTIWLISHSPATSLTVGVGKLLVRIVPASIVRIIVEVTAEFSREPALAADEDQDDEKDQKDYNDPNVFALLYI